MDPPTTIDQETEGHAIPIPIVKEAIESLPYASTERVMLQMLFYTGCRLTCLDRMYVKNFHGDHIYWQPGKHQRGWRNERLPLAYIEELKAYRKTHRVSDDRLFGVTGETFRGYFKTDIRPNLPPSWQRKRLVMTVDGMRTEYLYQLKGLRKNFQTLDFKRNLDKWGDPGLAIEMTSKRMLHSSTRITAKHYVENFDSLGINNLQTLDPANLLKIARQKRLLDYSH